MAHAAALDNLAANLARCGLRLSDICSEKLTGSFNAKQLEAVLSPVDSPKFRRCCGWIIDRINALIGSPRAVAVNTLHDLPFSKDLFSFLSDKSFLGWSTPAGASKEGPTSLRTFDFRLAVLMFLVAEFQTQALIMAVPKIPEESEVDHKATAQSDESHRQPWGAEKIAESKAAQASKDMREALDKLWLCLPKRPVRKSLTAVGLVVAAVGCAEHVCSSEKKAEEGKLEAEEPILSKEVLRKHQAVLKEISVEFGEDFGRRREMILCRFEATRHCFAHSKRAQSKKSAGEGDEVFAQKNAMPPPPPNFTTEDLVAMTPESAGDLLAYGTGSGGNIRGFLMGKHVPDRGGRPWEDSALRLSIDVAIVFAGHGQKRMWEGSQGEWDQNKRQGGLGGGGMHAQREGGQWAGGMTRKGGREAGFSLGLKGEGSRTGSGAGGKGNRKEPQPVALYDSKRKRQDRGGCASTSVPEEKSRICSAAEAEKRKKREDRWK